MTVILVSCDDHLGFTWSAPLHGKASPMPPQFSLGGIEDNIPVVAVSLAGPMEEIR